MSNANNLARQALLREAYFDWLSLASSMQFELTDTHAKLRSARANSDFVSINALSSSLAREFTRLTAIGGRLCALEASEGHRKQIRSIASALLEPGSVVLKASAETPSESTAPDISRFVRELRALIDCLASSQHLCP